MKPLALNKYRALETLPQRLADPIDARQLAIGHGWRDDEQAISVYKPEEPQLASYIFAHGQPAGCYGIHLEYPDLGDNDRGNAPLVCEHAKLERLLDLLKMHFGLDDIKQ
jgi:hypothetical protein